MNLQEQLNHELEAHKAEIAAIDEEIGRLILLKEAKEANMHKIVDVLIAHMPEQRIGDV